MLKKILLVAFTLLITLFASVGFAASKYDPAIAAAKAEIRSIVLGEYPDAQNIRIEVETDGNLRYYEAEFTTPKYKAELKINPHTGAICKRELEYF